MWSPSVVLQFNDGFISTLVYSIFSQSAFLLSFENRSSNIKTARELILIRNAFRIFGLLWFHDLHSKWQRGFWLLNSVKRGFCGSLSLKGCLWGEFHQVNSNCTLPTKSPRSLRTHYGDGVVNKTTSHTFSLET